MGPTPPIPKNTFLMTQTDLETWLAAAGIDTTNWGRDNAKTVADLAREIASGESTLQNDPPRRVVQVVQVIIPRGDNVLIETAQEFADGRVRRRDHVPSEKMLPNEEPIVAARRCLKEELGLNTDQLLGPPTYTNFSKKVIDSPSYPGLTTEFTMHQVRVETDALPTESFSTQNLAHADGDPVKSMRWAWLPFEQNDVEQNDEN